MSLKLVAIFIYLSYFSCFEAKILMSPEEIENSIENDSGQSTDGSRINLSMPGRKKKSQQFHNSISKISKEKNNQISIELIIHYSKERNGKLK